MTAATGPGRASLLARFAARAHALLADADTLMAANRLVGGIAALPFNIQGGLAGTMPGMPIVSDFAYVGFGVLILLHQIFFPKQTTWRRAIALPIDTAATSYEMYMGGGATAWLFAAFLWIIFGNGFRFGPRFLLGAMGLSLAGFAAVVVTTPFWHDTGSLAAGAFAGMIVLPLYALALIRRLSEATRQAEQASRAKSLFLASVSHELRTPLNAIIGMGALLETSPLDPDQAEMSETILTAARSLLQLIDGILDLSRIEAGRMPITRIDFDLVQVLGELRTIFQGQARQKGIALNLHVTARTPASLHGDVRRLHEILMNLIGNAMKFTEHGSVTVAVDAVVVDKETARVRIEVADTGIGIAPEAQGRIFENFTQADETILNRFGGTGLGLGITRKFVELLGGEIGVRSALGTGSIFWFELPFALSARADTEPLGPRRGFVAASDAEAAAPVIRRLAEAGVRVETIPAWPEGVVPDAEPHMAMLAVSADRADDFAELHRSGALGFAIVAGRPAEGLPPAPWRRAAGTTLWTEMTDPEMTTALRVLGAIAGRGQATAAPSLAAPQGVRRRLAVLVADDNLVNQRVLQRILTGAGHTVTLVGDGEQALETLAGERFDIALFDVNMPRLDGIEATKIYRMTALGGPEVPILALTADAMDETRERCLAAGMRACLVKPVEPARLLRLIEETAGDAGTATETTEPATDRPAAATLDPEVLANLRELGGEAFVAELGVTFRAEATAHMDALRAALARGEPADFRFHAHGLRSIAANMGALALCELCLPFQSIETEELRTKGMAHLASIVAELDRVGRELGAVGAAAPEIPVRLAPPPRRAGAAGGTRVRTRAG
ncbi:MAG: response regulator [Rhodospirillales bacterium]|nr:response regulator [Rhodospirillales bacterium]